MAKSVGNIRRLTDVLDDVGGTALVLYFSGGHYRQPLAFSPEGLEAAAAGARRIRDAGRRLGRGDATPEMSAPQREALLRRARGRLQHAARARRAVRVGREANRLDAPAGDADLREMLGVLGLEALLESEEAPAEAVALAAQREARAARQGLGRGRPAARRVARHGLGGARRPARTGARQGVLSRRAGRPLAAASARSSTAATRCARPAAGAAGSIASGRPHPEEWHGRDGGDRRGDRAALRLGRPPGRLRRGRSVPVRRRRRAARGARSAHRRARRGDRPAEPRRDLPDGRGVGGDRGRDPRAALGGGDAGGLQGVRGRGRAPAGRAGPQPRRLPRRRQDGRLLVLRRRRGREDAATRRRTGPAGWSWCSERRGRGCGRASRTPATTSFRCRSAAASSRSTSAPPRPSSCTRSCSTGLTRPHKRATLPLA